MIKLPSFSLFCSLISSCVLATLVCLPRERCYICGLIRSLPLFVGNETTTIFLKKVMQAWA